MSDTITLTSHGDAAILRATKDGYKVVSGAGSGPGGTASAPPGVTSVAAPLITVDNTGKIRLDFTVTYPAILGNMTDLSVRLEMPYSGSQTGDTSLNVPPQTIVDVQGPYPLAIVGGVVQNTVATIIEPAPTTVQTWAAWFYTSSKSFSNLYTDASAFLITFEVDPTAGLVAGAEWAPNPTGLTLTVDREVRVGAEQWWRPNLTWVNPSDDPLFTNVTQWNIGLYDPLIGAQDPEDNIITLGSITPDKTSFQSGWIKVTDSPIDFILMVRPVNSKGFQNSYVPGVTAALGVTIGPTSPLQDVTGFSVTAAYGPFDSTGKTALLLIPAFVPPADDPTWAYVDFWWQDNAGLWKFLSSIASDGVGNEAVVTQLPTAAFSTNFLAVAKDANGLDRDGNASTDPTNPPAGTPTFGPLTIQPANVVVPLGDVTFFSVTSAYGTGSDGQTDLVLIPSFITPNTTQWAWVEFWWTDELGAWRVLADVSSPGKAGEVFVTQLPTAVFGAMFLAVSQDVNGKDKHGRSTTPTGHCDVTGTAVHRTDGVLFDATFNGRTIYIGTTAYTVASNGFTDADHLTLVSGPGSPLTGASWVAPAVGTPAFGPLTITPLSTSAPLSDVTGFSVSTAYSAPDSDGKINLLEIPTFTPPVSPRWAWIEFWGTDANALWRVLGDPSSPLTPAIISQLPTSAYNSQFLAVSQDVNGKDKNGASSTPTGTCDVTGTPGVVHRTGGVPFDASFNSKTFYIGTIAYTVASNGFTDADHLTLTASAGTQSGASWICPAQGTPAFGPLTINPPAAGSAGQEYAGIVTGFDIIIGAPQGAADGSYNQPITPVFTPPTDTRWASVDIVVKYASGDLYTLHSMIRTSGQTFLWKTIAGSQTARFYCVSRNITGQRNSIVDPGVTPFKDKTVGSTSQLDLTAARLASFNQNQLRINPATGQFEAFSIDAAIIGQLQIGGGNANGTCNTVGTAVTGISGAFNSSMLRTPIWINGNFAIVASFSSSSSITIDRSFGNLIGAKWSWGMNPQFKVFDRGGFQIGFWGDDSFGTGFVGLFAGRNVRLGGTISNPILQVDSAGAVTIAIPGTNDGFGNAFTVSVDATNVLKVSNPAGNGYTQMTVQQVRAVGVISGVPTGRYTFISTSGAVSGVSVGLLSFDLDGANGLQFGAVPVVKQRAHGWGVVSGTVSRAAFNTATATLSDVIQHMGALLIDLGANGVGAIGSAPHGLIGA